MDVTELFDQLSQLNEQERIEAKKAEKIGKSILETICAFANEPDLKGGYLLLGISEANTQDGLSYQIVGVKNHQKLKVLTEGMARVMFVAMKMIC